MSVAYAVRNAAARLSGKIHDGVTRFLCVSNFVAGLMARGGFPAEKLRVVHNFVDLPVAPPRQTDGDYIACVGRISPEKGLDILVEAARQTGLPVKIAGDPSHVPGLLENLPPNVECVGVLGRSELPVFLQQARMMVVPSKWYEAFGLVAVEAMAYRLPVVASSIGGLPEVVRHGVDGLCVPPGNVTALADAMQRLWEDRQTARVMGESGVQRAANEFSPAAYYCRLMNAYREAISPDASHVSAWSEAKRTPDTSTEIRTVTEQPARHSVSFASS